MYDALKEQHNHLQMGTTTPQQAQELLFKGARTVTPGLRLQKSEQGVKCVACGSGKALYCCARCARMEGAD